MSIVCEGNVFMWKKVWRRIVGVTGIVGLLFSVIVISNDMKSSDVFDDYFTYRPPFTLREGLMLITALISVINTSAYCIGDQCAKTD